VHSTVILTLMVLWLPCCRLLYVCSLPAGAVAKVLQAAQAAETLPLDKGLELERCVSSFLALGAGPPPL
jgi:hypothetical protein